MHYFGETPSGNEYHNMKHIFNTIRHHNVLLYTLDQKIMLQRLTVCDHVEHIGHRGSLCLDQESKLVLQI